MNYDSNTYEFILWVPNTRDSVDSTRVAVTLLQSRFVLLAIILKEAPPALIAMEGRWDGLCPTQKIVETHSPDFCLLWDQLATFQNENTPLFPSG